MPIAGVVISTIPEKVEDVYRNLERYEGITTYGIHQNSQIIAVFEADTSRELERMGERLRQELDGILGIFPAYINFEDETDELTGAE